MRVVDCPLITSIILEASFHIIPFSLGHAFQSITFICYRRQRVIPTSGQGRGSSTSATDNKLVWTVPHSDTGSLLRPFASMAPVSTPDDHALVKDIPLSGWSEDAEGALPIPSLDKPSENGRDSNGVNTLPPPHASSGIIDIEMRCRNAGGAESLLHFSASVASDSTRTGSSSTLLDKALSIRGSYRNLSSASGASFSTIGNMPAKHPGWDETKDKEGHNPIQELENLADAMVRELLSIPNTGGGSEYFNAG